MSRREPAAVPGYQGRVMSRKPPVLVLATAAALAIGWARPMRPPAAPSGAPSPTFSVPGGRLRIEICADDIVRVAFAKDDAFFARPSLMAAPKRCTSPTWKMTKTDKAATHRDRQAARERRPDHRRGRVRGPGRASHPRRARRGTVAHARHRHRRERPTTSASNGGRRRRAPLRPRPAPAGAARHQGNRPRAAPVQQARSSSRCWCRAAATASSGTTRRCRASAGRSRAAWRGRSRAASTGAADWTRHGHRTLVALRAAHVFVRRASRSTSTTAPSSA